MAKIKVAEVHFAKPITIPHYISREGIVAKSDQHDLEMELDTVLGVLSIRGMPARLNGRVVECFVPMHNIASYQEDEWFQMWKAEDERIAKAAADKEAAGIKASELERRKAEDEARANARPGPESPAEVGAPELGDAKASSGTGGGKVRGKRSRPRSKSFS
jgi:hypothetical protein